MPERFPPIEPYDAGMLDVGDGQCTDSPGLVFMGAS